MLFYPTLTPPLKPGKGLKIAGSPPRPRFQGRGWGKIPYILLIGLAISWSCGFIHAQPTKSIDAIRLLTLDQKSVRLSAFPKRLLVLVFLSPECPVCQSYIATLNEVQKLYEADVAVLGVLPGKAYSVNDYRQFRKEYSVNFALLMDSPNALRDALKASITPEVFLVDAQRRILYAGAIDDQMVGLGRRKSQPTQSYLTSAIVAYQSGQAINTPRTKAIGCYINDF